MTTLAVIPRGFCHCGCGQTTTVIKETSRRRGRVRGEPNKYVAGHQPHRSREQHGMWKSGRTVTVAGYVGILVPEHPRASATTGYVLEHIVVAERALGHFLDAKHPVHHVDEDKANNTNDNLVICDDRAYHNLLHRRLRAYQACGDANAHRCRYCGTYDNQDDITVENLKNGWYAAHHRKCNAASALSHQQEYRRRRRERMQTVTPRTEPIQRSA
jgi:hypothetical protein